MSEQDKLWLLQNRIARIFNVITQYGEENFYISFSGGMDSTVLSALVDMALPDNQIPRVYADTGIEYKMIRDFVYSLVDKDNRFKIIKPKIPIIKMLQEKGYPFKSKLHSMLHERFTRIGFSKGILQYLGERTDKEPWSSQNSCPECLKYQFHDNFNLKISDKCCAELKEKPISIWEKKNKKLYGIVGIMRSEGGRRSNAVCLAFKSGKLKNFQPLVNVTKEWERWFIEKYNIDICGIYKPPYNFERTGCKGCPFALHLQKELDTLEKYFPAEYKQCEAIWKPVYDEYRRIGYRLKKNEQ